VNPVEIHILDGPLSPAPPWPGAQVGARVIFEGIVRPLENDRPIVALDYEAYQPMAERQLHHLASQLLNEHHLLAIVVQHSRGRVRVGECSFRLLIASRHRKEALAAMDQFIDRLKQEVPIWKSPVFLENTVP
jgi:molybdopterin synthase catalytic subunit